jgi:hypothetical protein
VKIINYKFQSGPGSGGVVGREWFCIEIITSDSVPALLHLAKPFRG